MLIDTVQSALKNPSVSFFLRTTFVKQGNVFSQLYFFFIMDMLSRTYFSSHAINTNGFSENKSEAILGLWDLSGVTDVA